MAGFHTKTFQVYDEYMTPKSAWEAIEKYLPKDKVIWEPFYGDGTSGKILTDLGFTVIHQQSDFFEENLGDVVVSNPPFSKVPQILQRLVELNKPFCLILPSPKIHTQYVRTLFKDDDNLQIIIPRRRIQFIKTVNGKPDDSAEKCCNFDCFYYCWKMNLPKSIIWLE